MMYGLQLNHWQSKMIKYDVTIFDKSEAGSLARAEWRHNGQLHRDNDEPAVIFDDGERGWYQQGKRHRDNGPAVISNTGSSAYYQFGKLHRIDGPAMINEFANRTEWWVNGKLHREDGPAIIDSHGVCYYKHGELHRIDGPAYVVGTTQQYYIEGIQYTFDEWVDLVKTQYTVKEVSMGELTKLLGYPVKIID